MRADLLRVETQSGRADLTNVQLFANLALRVRHLRGETFALYLAARHPETPWYVKWTPVDPVFLAPS